ncbi:MAG: anthranilate synthase component I [bacterium]|nr:MAG: anthranilate synthase component I [bacterium]
MKCFKLDGDKVRYLFTETLTADLDTPVTLFLKCRSLGAPYLLESAEADSLWGRYSFIGIKPVAYWKLEKDRLEKTDMMANLIETVATDIPFMEFSKRFSQFEIPEGLPRFIGGAVGFINYDAVSLFLPLEISSKRYDDFPLAMFVETQMVLVFDSFLKEIQIIYITENDNEQIAKLDIELVRNRLKYPAIESGCVVSNFHSLTSQERYERIVNAAKKRIVDGDIIQVVLAKIFSAEISGDPFYLYRQTRRINPSPYLFFLQMFDYFMFGSSPETLVRVEDKKIFTRPIAGTRRRGQTKAEDDRLAAELIADEKERAEHTMLVDLARNDVGRMAKSGTVTADNLFTVKKYSHVMHMVSDVSAELKEGEDAFSVLASCFPAGTVSGAPKLKAMQIIDELEDYDRGPYAGACGYFSYNGNMDMAITIRSLFGHKARLYSGAGAGIVYDSIASREWTETEEKAAFIKKAIEEDQR